LRFCDEEESGFGWFDDDEPMRRASHALAADGVWLVDPIAWPEAEQRALALGEPRGVLQLLDRHNRDCASVAAELGVPHVVTPDAIPGSPFVPVAIRSSRHWRERALWWPAQRTLVVAEAIGTNRFFTAGADLAGVHLLMRLSPPRAALHDFDPDHLLVGHGEGLHGEDARVGLRQALAHARTGLPRLAYRAPAFAVDAIRRRR
jgi:hypothetical protein